MAQKKRSDGNRLGWETLVVVASKHLNTMGVSVEWFSEIARDLRVTRPALYSYVSDRDDLLFKCYKRSCDVLVDTLDAAAAATDDPLRILDNFLTAAISGAQREVAALSEIDVLPQERQAIIRSQHEALVTAVAVIVRRGIDSGQFRAVDPQIVALSIIGMITYAPLARRWLLQSAHPQQANGARELLFHGLAASPEPDLSQPFPSLNTGPARIDLFDRAALEEARRETILVAASLLFNRRGVGGTRVDDVAAALGISKRTIYHYVGQKDALLDACIERAYKFYFSGLYMAQRSPGSRLTAIYGVMKEMILAMSDPDMAMLLPYVGFGQLSAKERRSVNIHAQELTEGYRTMLEKGQREGSMRNFAPYDILSASLPGIFTWVVNDPAPFNRDRSYIVEEIASIIVRGIIVRQSR
ncbi:TetR/AcrR family transcriptional regulator [Sphingomonas sp. CL5.1]|uniref:TetR family transcriptional regulator n=1 Tax=Sphingomonas sp. CL5.1 TaxID=2653203 RepID=UPI0015828BAF|nr:TetR family transcriptional regulator [Sphingomonas sp. CL5.1]QKS01123.1 TetR/AcrR family transcriptional regulator [Sphingomonas sp. CL5.1]